MPRGIVHKMGYLNQIAKGARGTDESQVTGQGDAV